MMEGKQGWRHWVISGLFEAGLIFLSVVLGLMLTAWAQDERERTRVMDMRGYIEQEMKTNRDMIAADGQLPHHKRLLGAVREAFATGMPTRDQAIEALQKITKTGLHLSATEDSVWKSVSSADLLKYMPPQDVFAIARVYRAQEALNMVNENLYAMLLRIPREIVRGDPPVGPMTTLQLTLSDVASAEEARSAGLTLATALLIAAHASWLGVMVGYYWMT